MAAAAWEYRVQSVGGILRQPKPEQLSEMLNQAALEGWELTHMVPQENSNALWLVLRRPSTSRTRRETSWPGAA
jgi:lipocalin